MSLSGSPSPQGDVGNESQEKVIKIDPDGDLTLVVGKSKTRFLVCSKALSRSARFWKSCLYGPFKERKPADGREWVVEFPEDNPSGLKYLLLLVHGVRLKLPKVDLQLAFEITVITNKYNMTGFLQVVAGSWLRSLKPLRPGDNDSIVPQLQWLWITRELGDVDRHAAAFVKLSQMVSTSATGGLHLVLKPNELGGADTLTQDSLEGYDAEKDMILFLTDEIKAAREAAISNIQRVLKTDTKRLRDVINSSKNHVGDYLCTDWNPNRQKLCEYAMQGIVTRFSAKKDSPLKSISEIQVSVEDFRFNALRFKDRIIKEIAYVADGSHTKCTPFRSQLPSLKTLKERTLLEWYAANTEAFEKKAQVSCLDKNVSDDDEEDDNTPRPRLYALARKRSRDGLEASKSHWEYGLGRVP